MLGRAQNVIKTCTQLLFPSLLLSNAALEAVEGGGSRRVVRSPPNRIKL